MEVAAAHDAAHAALSSREMVREAAERRERDVEAELSEMERACRPTELVAAEACLIEISSALRGLSGRVSPELRALPSPVRRRAAAVAADAAPCIALAQSALIALERLEAAELPAAAADIVSTLRGEKTAAEAAAARAQEVANALSEKLRLMRRLSDVEANRQRVAEAALSSALTDADVEWRSVLSVTRAEARDAMREQVRLLQQSQAQLAAQAAAEARCREATEEAAELRRREAKLIASTTALEEKLSEKQVLIDQDIKRKIVVAEEEEALRDGLRASAQREKALRWEVQALEKELRAAEVQAERELAASPSRERARRLTSWCGTPPDALSAMAAPSSPLGRRLSESGQPRSPAAVRLAALEVPVDADADDAAPAAPPPMRRLSIPEEAGAGVAASEAAATEAVERARAAAVAAASAPPLSPVHGKAGQLASEAAAAVARAESEVSSAHIESLERQLDAAELRVAAGALHACVRTGWLHAAGGALRRWAETAAGISLDAAAAAAGPYFDGGVGAARAAQGMRVARRRVARFGEGAPRNARLGLAILRAGNPLGCSPQLRALWRWRAFAGGEYRQAVIEEARRLRGERDAATERERGLKRGIATLREEKAKLDDKVAAAEGEAAAPDGDAAAARRAAREVAAIAAGAMP